MLAEPAIQAWPAAETPIDLTTTPVPWLGSGNAEAAHELPSQCITSLTNRMLSSK
jgi:hypothetical protein